MIELARVGVGHDNPTFRQVFTSRFIPGGTAEQLEWFNELCLKTTRPRSRPSCSRRARRSTSPRCSRRCGRRRWCCTRAATRSCPFRKGGCSRAAFPGAEFVELDSRNHVLLEHEPAWQRFQEAVLAFLRPAGTGRERSVFAALSAREREVLALMAEG